MHNENDSNSKWQFRGADATFIGELVKAGMSEEDRHSNDKNSTAEVRCRPVVGSITESNSVSAQLSK